MSAWVSTSRSACASPASLQGEVGAGGEAARDPGMDASGDTVLPRARYGLLGIALPVAHGLQQLKHLLLLRVALLLTCVSQCLLGSQLVRLLSSALLVELLLLLQLEDIESHELLLQLVGGVEGKRVVRVGLAVLSRQQKLLRYTRPLLLHHVAQRQYAEEASLFVHALALEEREDGARHFLVVLVRIQ